MTVFYLPRPEAEGIRVGFTVGKVLGGAVVRNRMKRRLREAVRLHGRIQAAMDVVINPKKTLLTAAFTDVQNEIRRAFEVIARAAGKS
jgi:ribonuclease P protein component